ncbi:MAG: EamA family transporter [Kiritimatiellae bacterium]|nr:EamA family transporter [Kiritimatiellia bacterium]MBR1836670.1 EamA family transporter [Kiritimatiellia bacterium]
MGNSLWPPFLIVGSNLVYQLSSRGAAKGVNPFAALVAAYAIAAAASLALYFATAKGAPLGAQLRSLNLSNVLLGFAIIGLEGGFLCLYRAGWNASVGPVVTYSAVAVLLLAVGALFLGENVGWRQVLGVALCLAGIALVTSKA